MPTSPKETKLADGKQMYTSSRGKRSAPLKWPTLVQLSPGTYTIDCDSLKSKPESGKNSYIAKTVASPLKLEVKASETSKIRLQDYKVEGSSTVKLKYEFTHLPFPGCYYWITVKRSSTHELLKELMGEKGKHSVQLDGMPADLLDVCIETTLDNTTFVWKNVADTRTEPASISFQYENGFSDTNKVKDDEAVPLFVSFYAMPPNPETGYELWLRRADKLRWAYRDRQPEPRNASLSEKVKPEKYLVSVRVDYPGVYGGPISINGKPKRDDGEGEIIVGRSGDQKLDIVEELPSM